MQDAANRPLPIGVVSAKSRLDALFDKVEGLEDLELQAHWARYLCVLASGYVETSVRAILIDYARDKASPPLRNYIESRLARFQNAKMRRILEEVRNFSPDWADQLEAACRGARKDAVDSLIANRHQIAHGADVGITFSRVRGYYGFAHEVVALLHDVCHESLPTTPAAR